MRLRPTDGQSLLNLAGIYGQLRKHTEAARAWELYLALDPGNFEAHVQRGTHLLLAGESEKAAAALKTALELQPDSARAYQILGDIYAGAEQADQAVLHYRKALEIEPGNVRVRLALGEVLVAGEAPAGGARRGGGGARRRRRQPLRPRPRRAAPCATCGASTRPTPWPTRCVAADPKDVKAAYLKVTIAESRRDFATAAALLEEILARPPAADEEGERATSASSWSTSASPTSSSSATPTRPRPSPARSRPATRPTRTC